MAELKFKVIVTPDSNNQLLKQADVIIRAFAFGIVGEMRRLMSLPKSGRTYKRSKSGKRSHRASAPGEAPAMDTGILSASIKARGAGLAKARIDITTDYAAYLEFGTRNPSGTPRMRPRPYIAPAIENVLKRTPGLIAKQKIETPNI